MIRAKLAFQQRIEGTARAGHLGLFRSSGCGSSERRRNFSMCRKPKYYAMGSARPWAPSRCLQGCTVALAVFGFGSAPSARAQVTISNGPSSNHVSGDGLSPSYFIPPSQLPVPSLEQSANLRLDPGPTTVPPQPSALPPANSANPASDYLRPSNLHSLPPSLVGSGVPSNPQFPSVVGS